MWKGVGFKREDGTTRETDSQSDQGQAVPCLWLQHLQRWELEIAHQDTAQRILHDSQQTNVKDLNFDYLIDQAIFKFFWNKTKIMLNYLPLPLVCLRDIFPKTVLYLYLFNILLSILSYFSFFVWKYFFFVFELLTRLPSLQLLLKFWQRILSVGLSCKLPNYLLFHHITHFPAKTSYYQKIRWNLNSQIIKNNYTNM